MKLTIGQKAVRVVKFLLGLRHPQVARALGRYGFTEEEMQRGWSLLAGLTQVSFEGVDPEPDTNAIQELDRFENVWFPVARATLAHRFPEVGAVLFRNLSQTGGAGVAVTVGTFLERLGGMARGEGEFAVAGPAARQLLAERGLRGEVVAGAVALIDRVQAIRQGAVPQLDRKRARQAEDALWAWYLEWSAIARVAVRDRRLLRAMGFLGGRRRIEPEDDGAEADSVMRAAAQPKAKPN